MDGYCLEEWVCPYCGCLNYNLQKCVRCHKEKISADVLQHNLLREIAEIHKLKLDARGKVTALSGDLCSEVADAADLTQEQTRLQAEYIDLAKKELVLLSRKIYTEPIRIIDEYQKRLMV